MGAQMHTNQQTQTTDYGTGETIRPATQQEREASLQAAETDGGSGVIQVDGRSVYVAD